MGLSGYVFGESLPSIIISNALLTIYASVAGQALPETLLLITPRDDLYICSARMLHSIQHALFPDFSIRNTRTLPCDRIVLHKTVDVA